MGVDFGSKYTAKYTADIAQAMRDTGKWVDEHTGYSDPAATTPADKNLAEKTLNTAGNLVWNALTKNKAEGALDFGMFGAVPTGKTTEIFNREILMSFLGTLIISTDAGASTTTTGATVAADSSSSISIPAEATIDFNDLKNGSLQAKNKFNCATTSSNTADGVTACDKLAANTPMQFVDAKTYIGAMLYGAPGIISRNSFDSGKIYTETTSYLPLVDGAGRQTPLIASPDSIVGKIMGSSSNPSLDADQSKFLNIMGDQIVALIRSLHANEYSYIPGLQQYLEPILKDKVALGFSDALLGSINNVETYKNWRCRNTVLCIR